MHVRLPHNVARLTAGAALTLLIPSMAIAGEPAPSAPMPSDPNRAGSAGEKPTVAPSRTETLQKLYADLANAKDPAAAEPIVRAIQELWVQSDSPTATLLLQRALAAAQEKNYEQALRFLDYLTGLYPDWAEGFNRRAYLYVVRLDYARALGDLRRVLALDPGNFRALEGLVQVLRTMGQDKAALDVVRELIKAHPNSPGAQEALKELERAVDGQGI